MVDDDDDYSFSSCLLFELPVVVIDHSGRLLFSPHELRDGTVALALVRNCERNESRADSE